MATLYGILAGAALKSLLVLAAAGLIAVLLRRHSAAVRHLVWMAAFGGLLALPVLTILMPGLPVVSLPRGPVFQARVDGAVAVGKGREMQPLSPEPRPSGGGPETRLPWREFVVWVWIAGCAFSFVRIIAAWLLMLRVRRGARSSTGIDGVDVWEARSGSMPMTFGLFRPAIFLPVDAANW